MKHKLAQVPPIGARRPYATHYFAQRIHDVVPERIGHCASRKGAVLAAVKRMATFTDDLDAPTFTYVEVYDDLGVCCNVIERRGETVAVMGYY